ncbi:MAG: hypothetical protein ACP5MG_13770 [Verrucomicrobiia bacterium]
MGISFGVYFAPPGSVASVRQAGRRIIATSNPAAPEGGAFS